jgi:hypothetical protein
MKLVFKVFTLTISILIVFTCNIYGQVTASGTFTKVYTAYDSAHLIYVYNQTPSARKGDFTARSPWGGNANFTWSRFDTVTKAFLAPFRTKLNTDTTLLSTLIGGGYRVTVDSGATKKDTFVFWYYPHKDTTWALKNAQGFVYSNKYTCNYVRLDAVAKSDIFYYYNPVTKKRYQIKNGFKYSWSANHDKAGTLKNDSSFRIYDPPTKFTIYTVTAIDSFNYKLTDNVKFNAVRAKAAFDTICEAPVEFAGQNLNSAPFTVTFKDSSENVNKLTWYFGNGDTLISTRLDSVFLPAFDTTYYKTGNFNVRLIVENKYHCIDSVSKTIKVDEAQIKYQEDDSKTLPQTYLLADGENIFRPTFSDSIFKPQNASVKGYSLIILSRWGKVVYKEARNSKGPYMENIQGWNGMINGKLANEGIYYYILTSTPYEPYDKKTNTGSGEKVYQSTLKGFFYLFHRNK